MALYTENNDWQRFARERLQNSANNLQQKQAGLTAAQNKKTKTSLESALSGLVTGIGERIGDIGNTLNNMGKTVVGGINQIGQNKAIENTTKKDSERRNEIAKKYGFNSYSEAANSGKVGDDFWNEIKGSNEQTKKEQKEVTDKYRNTGKYGDVTKVNTNMAKGQALNTIDSVLGLIPGAWGVAANVAGGAISGVGDEYKRVGRDGGNFNLDNALKNAAVGGASGLAGSAGAAGLGKVATKFGGNAVGKALGSNLASGIAGGASAGGIGGALGTALNGGSLEDSLAAALEGAKAGGIGGGVMAGTMGLGGTALEKLRNKKGATKTPTAVEPVEAQIVAKDRIEAPRQQRIAGMAETIEPTRSPRGVDIIDLDAGEQVIPVRSASSDNRGRYIDSVVDRAKANLPEAKMPSTEQRFRNNFDKTLEDLIYGGDMGDNFKDIANTLKVGGITADDIARLKSETGSYAADNNPLPETTKGNLPKLSLDDYMKVKGYTKREDIPQEMLQFLRKDGERFDIPDQSWGEMFPERTQGAGNGSVDITADDIIDYYENVASTPSQRALYTPENVAGALYMNPELNNRFQTALLEQYNPAHKIAVQGGPAISEQIPVFDTSADYRKSTIPAHNYAPETAGPSAPTPEPQTTALANTPEQRVATQRQVAVDPATQAKLERDMYVAKQRQGQALLDQYGTLERPYRRMVGGDPAGVLNTLYDDYGLKTPAEVQFAANHVTGKDGTVTKMTRKLANSAENVPTAIKESFLNEIIKDFGLKENDAKSIKDQVKAVLARTGADGYSDGATTLQTIKNLEGKIRDIRGESGTYHNMTYEDKCRASALQMVRDELTDRLWANADIKTVMTEDNLNTLRNMYKDNPTWQDFVNNKLANAKDGAELRALMKPLVNGGHIIEGAQMTAGSVGEKLAGAAAKAGSAKGAAKNVLSVGIDMVFNSDKAKQKRAESYARQAKNAEAQLYGEAPVANTGKIDAIKQKAGKAGETVANIANKTAEKVGKATAGLNDTTLSGMALGGSTVGDMLTKATNRSIAKDQVEFANNRANVAQKTAEFEQAANDYTQAIAEQQAAENQLAQGTSGASGTANMLTRINNAMELAMQAGDINAYSQLADLYKQAYNIYEMQNPQTKNEGKALSANQSKALAASQQLEQLAQMTPNAGTVASTIPVLGGIVDLTGGNEYANQAEALATTLGYLLSGANIKESEAKRIGQSYVPSAFDSEAVRQQKLDRARQLIQSYMSDTGAIQQ